MYQVLLDGLLIHNPASEVSLGEPVLTLTDNKTGAFDFQMYPGNPGYGLLNKLRSVIQVFRGEEELFRGRIIDEEKDFSGIKRIACEGEMSFLLDSIQKAKAYPNQSLMNYLKSLLDNHNNLLGASKRIELGNVTMTDPAGTTQRSTNWEPTLTYLNDLLNNLGGHFRLRYAEGKRYLDYLESYGQSASQMIEFGENLLDYSEATTVGDIATCIIPLGKKLDSDEAQAAGLQQYTTIEPVNGGKDYLLNDQGVTRFGVIARTVNFEDIDTPAALKTAGAQYLSELQFESLTLSVKAIDLSLMDVDIAPIRMGDNIRVCSLPHGMDRVFPVLQRTYHLTDPTQDTITLGDTLPKTFDDTVSSITKDTAQAIGEQAKSTGIFADTAKSFSAMAASSVGCYETTRFENGSSVHYWHDQPQLSNSKSIRKSSAAGYFFSTEGGKEGSWRGIDQNTNALLESLTTKKIVADIIQTGKLKSNNSNNVYFDLDQGVLSANKLVSDNYSSYSLTIGASEIGDSGAINVKSNQDNIFSVYKVTDGSSRGTVITSPWKTNGQGSNRKGVAIYDDSIMMFADKNGDPRGINATCNGVVTVFGDFNVTGTKSRVVSTTAGEVCVAAYETAEPMFGDIGEAQIGPEGTINIQIDALFAETVNTTDYAYQVFLQPYAEGVFWVSKRAPDFFVVHGPAHGQFAWEIKGRQKGYETVRLKQMKQNV